MPDQIQKKNKLSFTHAGAFWTGYAIGTFSTVMVLWLFMKLMLRSVAIP